MSRPKYIFAAVAACVLAGGLMLETHSGHANNEGSKALPQASVSASTPFKISADGTFVAPPLPPAPQMPPAPGMAPSPQNSPPPPPTLAPPPTRAP